VSTSPKYFPLATVVTVNIHLNRMTKWLKEMVENYAKGGSVLSCEGCRFVELLSLASV
jgi:hypothetical protein